MFLDEMKGLRDKRIDKKVADTILQLLDRLRYISNENNKVRWIWELVQNAKDVTNHTGKVKININTSKSSIEFSHNGRVFTTENLICLIEQVSSKDREDDNLEGQIQKATGKFGTGFLTTHLLSSKVEIDGILEDKDGVKRYINFILDRSGRKHNEITDYIRKSYNQINQSKKICDSFDEDNFNTTFKYELDEKSILVAKNGIENLCLEIPYVFTFVSEIESITINNGDITFQRGEIHSTNNDNINIYELLQIENGQSKKKFICVLEDDDISIAVPILDLESKKILEYKSQMPKIFCDFPLIGTEKFAFPVVINSPLFNPTEPRDSIFLLDEDEDKTNENRKLMLKVRELYNYLLEFFINNEYKQIYNVTRINSQEKMDFISTDWVNENVVEKCKEFIKYKSIINTQDGKRNSLYDEWLGKSNIWIISDDNPETREEVWELANYIYREKLTKKSEIHNWYNSLWNECHNFSLIDLIKKVEQYKTFENLQNKLNGKIEGTEWLNRLYELIYKNDEARRYVLENNIKIFPNQNGKLCRTIDLKYDVGIDDVYKEISKEINNDCKEKLLYLDISNTGLLQLSQYTYDELFTDIQNSLSNNKQSEEEVYKKIIILYNNTNEQDEEVTKLIYFIDMLSSEYLPKKIIVNEISQNLLDSAKKYMCIKLADKISSYGNIEKLEKEISLSENINIKEFMVAIVEYFIKYDHRNLLNKKTKPILPNQNGIFKVEEELFLDSGDIDEELKDISSSVGNDIRKDLLIKDIFLKLPDNRTKKIKDIASGITAYVRENQGEAKKEETTQDIYRKLYLWICNNKDKAKEYFQDIYKNKHWLYNDTQITECMEKSDKYDEVDKVLKQYNIKNINQLNEILNKKEVLSNFESSEISNTNIVITRELLAQYGIYTQDALDRAIENKVFGENFTHDSEKDKEKLDFVNGLLERSKKHVMDYLHKRRKEYNLGNVQEVDKTIFIVEKDEKQICLIIRPSDYNQVIIYYDSEKDVLDSQEDMYWELWVEDGKNDPQQLNLGKILKLTGINRIPLKRIR